ncbi:MAG: HAD family phosphatase [Acidobacteriaceae bacterium]|nr:HAD family phosphatase [Acidobacteriaceae bacterium]
MSEIQAVLFDYGMVLSGPPDPKAWAEMKRLLGVASEERFHAAYWKFRDAYDRGELTGEGYWEAVAKELGEEAEVRELLDADTMLWTQPNQEMIDWAVALQHGGWKTGILSNIGDAMELGVMARWPWMRGFTHHTFSHRLRMAKPELAIYRHAAEGLGVPAEAVLFVDDREENIAAAREAGMKAVRYSSHEQFVADMQGSGWGELLSAPPQKA